MDFYQSHRQKIIVSADDFGISPRANRNILHLISLGKIDRVGIMAYGEISASETEELVRSGVKLDIHLDILHEFDKNRKKRRGAASRILDFSRKILTGRISTTTTKHDWQNQIERFHEIFGRYPDGINSHEHVHFFPPFFKIALCLQEKYGIPYVRFGEKTMARYVNAVARILKWLRKINCRTCTRSNCVSSGTLVSLDWISDLDEFLDNLPEGTIEIACHPELAEEFVQIKKYF